MKTIYKVFLISLIWVIVVSPLRVGGDSAARLQMAHAWLTGTEEITDPTRGRIGVIGRDGKRYIPYDVGQSLLMLPGNWLGIQLHKAFPKQPDQYLRLIVARWVTFLPLNLALIVACFWLLEIFNFSERVSALGSIAIFLGTTIMHYVQSSQQNNQILLFVVLGYGCALVCAQSKTEIKNKIFALLSGLALGAAFLIRQTSILHILTVFLFIGGCTFYQKRNIGKTLKTSCLWALGLLPLVLVSRIFDYVRVGVFWRTAASFAAKQRQLGLDPLWTKLPEVPPDYPFSNPPWVGIWGVLFSPSKSIFIYDPLLLPCLLLGIILWKKLSPYIKLYLIANTFNLLLHLAFYSKLDFWHGDAAWGARYHVTSVHLLLIPLIALLIQNLLSVRGLYLWLIRLLFIIAIMVQFSSIVLRPSTEGGRIYSAQPESFMRFRLAERVINVGCLINDSVTPDCQRRLAVDSANPLITKVSLLPLAFTQSRNLAFAVWGLLLVVAILSTLVFYLDMSA